MINKARHFTTAETYNRFKMPALWEKQDRKWQWAMGLIGIVILPVIAAIAALFFLTKAVYSVAFLPPKHEKNHHCKEDLANAFRMICSLIPGASLYWMFRCCTLKKRLPQ